MDSHAKARLGRAKPWFGLPGVAGEVWLGYPRSAKAGWGRTGRGEAGKASRGTVCSCKLRGGSGRKSVPCKVGAGGLGSHGMAGMVRQGPVLRDGTGRDWFGRYGGARKCGAWRADVWPASSARGLVRPVRHGKVTVGYAWRADGRAQRGRFGGVI
jgi:hypothetical protein